MCQARQKAVAHSIGASVGVPQTMADLINQVSKRSPGQCSQYSLCSGLH